MHLEHVNMTVTDLDRSVRFYAELLGLRIRWQGATASGRRAAHVGSDDWYIAIFEAERAGTVESDYDGPGLNHFGIVVEDLDTVTARLAAVGARVHGGGPDEHGRRAYVFDPDGIELELVEPAPASAA